MIVVGSKKQPGNRISKLTIVIPILGCIVVNAGGKTRELVARRWLLANTGEIRKNGDFLGAVSKNGDFFFHHSKYGESSF